MARTGTSLVHVKAALLPGASIERGTGSMVLASARLYMRKNRRSFPVNLRALNSPSLRKHLRELWREHRAAGGTKPIPALEKMEARDLRQLAREIDLVNQTLRGERPPVFKPSGGLL